MTTDFPANTAQMNVRNGIVLIPAAILISADGVNGKQYKMNNGVNPLVSSHEKNRCDEGMFFCR
ncbi:fimbrial adhesin [Paenibacillus sp. NAIST15-1]|nr:fimbrial adhesin [Paenibacillus sp. NAIST15-1]